MKFTLVYTNLLVYCLLGSAILVQAQDIQPIWTVNFSVEQLNTAMLQTEQVQLTISDIPEQLAADFAFHVLAEHENLLHIVKNITSANLLAGASTWTGNVTMQALFLGHTNVFVELRQPGLLPQRAQQTLAVIILRNVGPFDTVFKLVVGSFVMLLYVQFGAAVDVDELKNILLRPVGPAIGFVAKFLIMPVLGYTIGYLFFHDEIELRLGLFFTSVTPAGGSSNIFTALLDANLNLSITMTALSNLAAFIMMPVWIFSLGALIFNDGNFVIPYGTIATTSCSLVLPLSVGIALQKYAPDFVQGTKRYLKTFSLGLIIILMIFAFSVNSFMFQLFSFKIILASASLSWLGYVFGWLVARVLRQTSPDAMAIAIETGIENSGIAIFMLNFTLPQPQADITSAVPVANSFMTPLPLLIIWLLRKCRHWCRNQSVENSNEEAHLSTKQVEVLPTQTQAEIKAIMEQAKADLKVF